MTFNTPIQILEEEVRFIKKDIDEKIYVLHNFNGLPNKFRNDLERSIMLLNMDKIQILEAIDILKSI